MTSVRKYDIFDKLTSVTNCDICDKDDINDKV